MTTTKTIYTHLTSRSSHCQKKNKKKKTMCKYKETKGDLFKLADVNSDLAHCVSEDLAMGKGIATTFKKTYGKVSYLKSLKKKVGECASLRIGKENFAHYLITKKKYYNKPQVEDLERSLIDMKKFMEENNRFHLSIPKIGCGLDRLDWEIVKEIIQETFDDRFTVDVYFL